MIEVGLHGTNYITLKGDCLSAAAISLSAAPVSQSAIALHKDGWALTVVWDEAGWVTAVLEGLHRNRVIPTLAKLLVDNGLGTETVNMDEINKYMDVIQSRWSVRVEVVGEGDQPALRLALAFVEQHTPNGVTTDVGKYDELLEHPERIAGILRTALGETL